MISQRISQLRALAARYRFGAVCVGIGVTLALSSAILFKYQLTLTNLHRKRQSEGEAVLATLRSAPELRQELASTREISGRIDATLVSDIDLGESIQYFYRMRDSTGVSFDSFNALNVQTDNNPEYKRIPFAIRASGTYLQLATLIHAIETGPRLANIAFFTLKRKGNNLLTLEINVELLGHGDKQP